MRSGFLKFIFILVAVLGGSTFYFGYRFIPQFAWTQEHAPEIWILLFALIVAQILSSFLYRQAPQRLKQLRPLLWISYSWLGVFTCFLYYTFAADVISAVGKLFLHQMDPSRFQLYCFWTADALAIFTVVVGSLTVYLGPWIYRVEVPIAGLPEAFDGFKIAQISDLHVGPTIGRRYTQKVVNLTNSLKADAIALTGDFLDGSVEQLSSGLAPISQLKAEFGMFYILGNHEFYWDAPTWAEHFKTLGARVLLNQHAVLKRGTSEIVMAGVTDISAGAMIPGYESDPAKAIIGAPKDAIKILLAHQPASYKAAAVAGYHLQLSGHTHGGQFFPWSMVVALVQTFNKGLGRFENLWIYVNRGTGYWGPPLRFGVPSEITLLTLKRST
jgi:uncharacterized protein